MSRPRRRPGALGALIALLGLLGLGLSGCGGAGSDTAGVRTTPGPHTSANRVTSSSSSTTTGATSSSTLPGTGRPMVTIGDKNYAEQFVLGQLYLQALEAQGFTVSISQNIGPPSVVRQALANHSLAMYPEYLNVFDETIAGQRRPVRSLRSAFREGQSWARRHGLRLLTPTAFGDTDGVAVTDAYAAAHRLRSLSDLARVGTSLTIGGAVQFRGGHAGLPGLSTVYGVVPSSFKALAVGEQYMALDAGSVQAAYVNTTDGELASGDYKLLGDPRRIFGWGNVVPVITRVAEAKEGPAFAATINRVDATLTLTAIRELNDAASESGANPSAIADQYLETHGLLSPLRASQY